MSLKTQGTHLFIIDPDDCSVLQIECPRGISGFGGTVGEDDDTLVDDEGPVFSPGAFDAGSPTFDLDYDPAKGSHVRLYELFRDKTPNLQFAIGFPDGTAIPAAEEYNDNECEWVLPASRTYGLFQGFISGMPLDFALNDRVTTTVTIRASGFPSIRHIPAAPACAFPLDDSITALLPGSVPLQVSGTAPVQTVTGPEVIAVEVLYVTSTYNPGYPGFTNDWPADEIRWICQVSDIVPFSIGGMYGDSMMVSVGSLTTGASFYAAIYAFDAQTVLYYGWTDQATESDSRTIALPFTGMADTLAVGLTGSGDCYVRVNDKTYKVLTNADTPVNIGVSENLYLLHQILQDPRFPATGPTSYVSRTFADDFIGTFPAIPDITKQADLCGNIVRED